MTKSQESIQEHQNISFANQRVKKGGIKTVSQDNLIDVPEMVSQRRILDVVNASAHVDQLQGFHQTANSIQLYQTDIVPNNIAETNLVNQTVEVVQRVQVDKSELKDIFLLGDFANLTTIKPKVIAQSNEELTIMLNALSGKEKETLEKVLGQEYKTRLQQLPPPKTLDEKGYDVAINNHKANVTKLGSLIDEGKSASDAGTPDPKYGIAWPNTAAWIKEGKTRLMALTQTHDSAARVTAQGGNSVSMIAYLGSDKPIPQESTYNRTNKTDKTNTIVLEKSITGQQEPGKIVIVEPSKRDNANLKNTLVHEVQHDADKHASNALDRYKTEFRAYWLDQSYESKSPTEKGKTVTLNTFPITFANERQMMIFAHLYRSDVYAYVKQAWLADPGFRAAVAAYKQPESVNWINSPRIEDLRVELSRGKFDLIFHTLDEVKSKANKLNSTDKAAIKTPEMKDNWSTLLAKFKTDNGQSAHDEIKSILDAG